MTTIKPPTEMEVRNAFDESANQAEVRKLYKRTHENAQRLGELLYEARQHHPASGRNGTWGKYLEEVGIPDRTARRYIALYRGEEEREEMEAELAKAKAGQVAGFPLVVSKAAKLAEAKAADPANAAIAPPPTTCPICGEPGPCSSCCTKCRSQGCACPDDGEIVESPAPDTLDLSSAPQEVKDLTSALSAVERVLKASEMDAASLLLLAHRLKETLHAVHSLQKEKEAAKVLASKK